MAGKTNTYAHQPNRRQVEQLATHIYTTDWHRLLSIARRNSLNHDDAEDALQDSFILFLNHFEPDQNDHALAWFTLTLKRRCWAIADTRRRIQKHQQPPNHPNAPQPPQEPADTAPSLQETTETASGIEKIRHQLKTLKPAERNAIGLFALGYSYREIATITGWTYTKVNRSITEGRATLRRRRDPHR